MLYYASHYSIILTKGCLPKKTPVGFGILSRVRLTHPPPTQKFQFFNNEPRIYLVTKIGWIFTNWGNMSLSGKEQLSLATHFLTQNPSWMEVQLKFFLGYSWFTHRTLSHQFPNKYIEIILASELTLRPMIGQSPNFYHFWRHPK